MSSEGNTTPRQETHSLPFVNARGFERQLEQAAKGVAGGVPHALFAIHLECLHDVEKACGVEARSALFEKVCGSLSDLIGPGACAYRIAPDEVAILKDRCLRRDAVHIARRFRDALQGGTFLWHGHPYRLGASVGVLEMDDDARRVSDMLGRAVEACQVARTLGSKGVLIFDGSPGEQEAAQRERLWREHITEVLG